MGNRKQPEFKVIMKPKAGACKTLEELLNSPEMLRLGKEILITKEALKPEFRNKYKKENEK